jgi:hypothetical protein
MKTKNLFYMFLALCLGLSACSSVPYAKTDFSKKIEIKKSLFPELKQSGEEIGLGSFEEHPDLDLRKDYVSLRRRLTVNYYAHTLATGSLVYGLLADEEDFVTYGYISMVSLFFIFVAQNRYGTLSLANKHNKKLGAKSTQIMPGYNPEAGNASLNAFIRF